MQPYNKLQDWLGSGNSKHKFYGLLVGCILVYLGMLAGISFLPKKKENTNTWDTAGLVGWSIMVVLLLLSTWILVLMNPHGFHANNLVSSVQSSFGSDTTSTIASSEKFSAPSETTTASFLAEFQPVQ